MSHSPSKTATEHLIRIRIATDGMTRRHLLQGAAAASALALAGAPKAAHAATPVKWLGWQGYEAAIRPEFLNEKDIALETTFISDATEIITKLRLSKGSYASARLAISLHNSWRARGCSNRSILRGCRTLPSCSRISSN